MGLFGSKVQTTIFDDRVEAVFSDVEQRKFTDFCSETFTSLVEKQPFFSPGFDTIVAQSEESGDRQVVFPKNGLIGCMYHAFKDHVPLVVRPDDLWTSITFAFGHYVEKHAEEMRSVFVSHEGKKHLEIRAASFEELVELACNLIGENTKMEVAKWMEPEFSTTTKKDKMVVRIGLMAAMNHYFSYGFSFSCGLSKVVLLGKRQDWRMLIEKCKYLYTFKNKDLSHWADLLIPVLIKFLDLYDGKGDGDFWQRICLAKGRGYSITDYSGDQKLRGWFLVFSPFDESGKLHLNSVEVVNKTNVYGSVDDDNIVACSCEVPVIFTYGDGSKSDLILFAGQRMMKYKDGQLSPDSDWAIVEKKRLGWEDMEKHIEKGMEFWGDVIKMTKEEIIQIVKTLYDQEEIENGRKLAWVDQVLHVIGNSEGKNLSDLEQIKKRVGDRY